ncbi:hypothetical protein B9P82_27345 [Citrobacter sp. L55]|nr:hypothetical protein B9P82_27345 [Citrobacter sp. L55]
MDYRKLSDKDINKLVAFALGCKEVVPDIFMSDERRKAYPGCTMCVSCQGEMELRKKIGRM